MDKETTYYANSSPKGYDSERKYWVPCKTESLAQAKRIAYRRRRWVDDDVRIGTLTDRGIEEVAVKKNGKWIVHHGFEHLK